MRVDTSGARPEPPAQTIVDLRDEPDDWDPSRLTTRALRWTGSFVERSLADLVTTVAPGSVVGLGAQVITPVSIHAESGALVRRSTNYQGPVFQVGSDLMPGDVLVAVVGARPALLVTDDLHGALVSSRFLAMRPGDPGLGLWLWAVVSSQSGLRQRLALSRGTTTVALDQASYLAAAVPVASLPAMRRIAPVLQHLHDATRSEEVEPAATWWHRVDLRTTEWRFALATPDASIFDSGRPLADFCDRIVRGKDTRRAASDESAPGLLPVADVSLLGGAAPRRWVSATANAPTLAEPGDLLVAGLGTNARALVAAEQMVVDAHVLMCRLQNPHHGSSLARYLNGHNGQRVRTMFLTGATTPHLSAGDLGRIPVPETAFETPALPTDLRPLAARLEEALWAS